MSKQQTLRNGRGKGKILSGVKDKGGKEAKETMRRRYEME